MRKSLALLQLVCFGIVGAAILAPEFPRVLRDWSGATIYPWWAGLYIVVGVIASVVSVALGNQRWGPVVPTVLVVLAGQLAGLGFVAVKHWQPSFGMGGGYAGQPDDLARLAWIIGLAGAVAGLSAVAQLVLWRAFPLHARSSDVLLFGGVGALVLLALPFGIGEGDPQLRDLTSLGAFVLIYSGPIGVCVAGAAWLSERLRAVAVGACAAAAAFSALGLITDLSYLKGRPALLATALLLTVFAVYLRGLPETEAPNRVKVGRTRST